MHEDAEFADVHLGLERVENGVDAIPQLARNVLEPPGELAIAFEHVHLEARCIEAQRVVVRPPCLRQVAVECARVLVLGGRPLVVEPQAGRTEGHPSPPDAGWHKVLRVCLGQALGRLLSARNRRGAAHLELRVGVGV